MTKLAMLSVTLQKAVAMLLVSNKLTIKSHYHLIHLNFNLAYMSDSEKSDTPYTVTV